MFHIFRNLSVPKPTFCDFCGDIVWDESKKCEGKIVLFFKFL